MTHEDPLNYLGPTIEHLTRHWESRRRAAAARGEHLPRTADDFTIALSREAGIPGTSVAREVGNRLGWQVYDHELLERIAQEMHVRTALLESVDERHQSWLLEALQGFPGVPNKSEWRVLVSESAYVRHLVETVLALGIHGQCVIVGRGAAFLLPAETTLRVRLVAPVKERIAMLRRRLALSEEEASHRVQTVGRERHDFVQDHFQKDPTDATHYDLVLNAGRLPVAAAVGLIIEALRHLQAAAADRVRAAASL
jgi:cytidylate kinase